LLVQVYHHDIPQAVCRATGDPNLTTFDRLFYSVYASGQFTYVQTTRGSPIEVNNDTIIRPSATVLIENEQHGTIGFVYSLGLSS